MHAHRGQTKDWPWAAVKRATGQGDLRPAEAGRRIIHSCSLKPKLGLLPTSRIRSHGCATLSSPSESPAISARKPPACSLPAMNLHTIVIRSLSCKPFAALPLGFITAVHERWQLTVPDNYL